MTENERKREMLKAWLRVLCAPEGDEAAKKKEEEIFTRLRDMVMISHRSAEGPNIETAAYKGAEWRS